MHQDACIASITVKLAPHPSHTPILGATAWTFARERCRLTAAGRMGRTDVPPRAAKHVGRGDFDKPRRIACGGGVWVRRILVRSVHRRLQKLAHHQACQCPCMTGKRGPSKKVRWYLRRVQLLRLRLRRQHKASGDVLQLGDANREFARGLHRRGVNVALAVE